MDVIVVFGEGELGDCFECMVWGGGREPESLNNGTSTWLQTWKRGGDIKTMG